MGREAKCDCQYGVDSGAVKALLESSELILRGAVRKHIPLAEICNLAIHEEELRFQYHGETVALALGKVTAEKWLAALGKPPVSLAKKLGITAETRVHLLGKSDDPALATALRLAAAVSNSDGNLVLACVNSLEDLESVLHRTVEQRRQRMPIWIIYLKGLKSGLSESQVRAALRNAGMKDTKVASVSSVLTALRFNSETGRRS